MNRKAAAVVEKPDGISMDEAARIGVPFVTAIEGFRRSGLPKPNEYVLIFGVNGKVGQAAVQLATWQGAKVIGMVRRDEAYEGHSNAPIEIVNSSATDVAARVHELTGGHGADLQHCRRSLFRHCAPCACEGRTADPDRDDQQDRAVQHPGILPRPAHLSRRRHPRLLGGGERQLLRSALPGFAGGFLRPYPITASAIYPLAEARLRRGDRVVAQPLRAAAGSLTMHVVRFNEAPAYSAPGHHDMAVVRVQGHEAGPSSDVWAGVSVTAPGGGTTLSGSDLEKIYVVLEGKPPDRN